MDFDVVGKTEFSMLKVKVPAGETLKVEASAMAAQDSNLKMKTRLKGGFKRFLSKESLFINEFTAEGSQANLMISPGPAGDIGHYRLPGDEEFFITSSCYLASETTVEIDTKFQGVWKSMLSGEGFFLIKCSGSGDVWFNTYGALIEIDVDGEYIVDTGHIVAFNQGLDYDIDSVGGYKALFFSGEAFVARFRGQGKVWVQTKLPLSLVKWADSYRRIERRSQ